MEESPDILARDLLRSDDLDGAHTVAESALDAVSDQGTDTRVWRLRFIRAEILRLRGNPEEAIAYLQSQQSAQPPEQNDLESRAALDMHLGYHCGMMARYEPALRLLARAELLSRQIDMIELQGDVSLRQAMVFFLQKRYEQSTRAFRSVLNISEKLDGWYFRGNATWGIGKNLMIQRLFTEALPWLENSLNIFEAAGAQLSVATVWSEMGVCELGLGNDIKALDLFQNSAQTDYEAGVIHNYQVSLANIGNVYLHRGDLFTALSYYQKALELSRQIKDPVSIKKWTNNIRLAYAKIRSEVDQRYPRSA